MIHCVQCGKEMPKGVVTSALKSTNYLPVCFNEKCPNYGLVQLGIENMYGERNRDDKPPKKKA